MALNVHLYNLLHTGNPGDLEFYLASCSGARSVLELGCGSGRVALALAKNGSNVTGIDNDRAMVEAFKHAGNEMGPKLVGSAHIQRLDMRSFSLGKRFDKVIIPFNSLLCMLNDEDVVRTLTCAAAHLEADGELIFDIYYVPEHLKNEGDDDEFFEEMGVIDDGGANVRAYEKTFVLSDPQRFDTAYQLVYESGEKKGATFEFTIEQRCIYLEAMEHLLLESGLELKSITADFTDKKVEEMTDQVVVRAVPIVP